MTHLPDWIRSYKNPNPATPRMDDEFLEDIASELEFLYAKVEKLERVIRSKAANEQGEPE